MIFLLTSNFCSVSLEPLTITIDCVNSEPLKYACICLDVLAEPDNFVLKERLYSISFPISNDSDVYIS